MKQLKQAIDNNDCLLAGLSLANIFQPEDVHPQVYLNTIQNWREQAQIIVNSNRQDLVNFKRLLHFFYVRLGFSGDHKDYFSSQHNLLSHVMDYRTGIPVSLAIVLQALAKSLGFVVYGVNFPGHFLLKCECENDVVVYVDPLNGNLLDKSDLSRMYFSILTELEDEGMPEEALSEASCSETIVRLLHNLKASYINQKSYSLALQAVQLLVELCPNDPYERRDRGFLLHQLDCTQVAIADYQYFIRQCPEDPSSQLLEAQLQKLSGYSPQVFH